MGAPTKGSTAQQGACNDDYATRVRHLVSDPAVEALVVAVPPRALAEVLANADVVHKPVLLSRPVPDLDSLIALQKRSRVELVPGLHLSVPVARTAAVDEIGPSAVGLELTAGSAVELESAAIEALELAWSLLGGPPIVEPVEVLAYGGPSGGPAGWRGRSLRGSLRFEGEDGVRRRLDLRLAHRVGSSLHGRLTLGSSGKRGPVAAERVAALVPRRDGVPSSADLVALASGLRGPNLGLDLRTLATPQSWWRRLRRSAGFDVEGF